MLEMKNVTKTFGTFPALDDLSLTVPRGAVYGLVGPNGAGKSTAIRLLTGVYRPDSGQITMEGAPIYENPTAKMRIGYIPDDIFYFPSATLEEMRKFYKGIYPQFDDGLFERLYEVFNLSVPLFCFPHNLFPLVAIANYLLFFGKDVVNVFPMSWRANFRRLLRKSSSPKKAKTIPFPTAGSYQATQTKVKAPYNHKCTICGRTDISDPQLEFRYCSRCSGYHCYCEDHISNHTHIQ